MTPLAAPGFGGGLGVDAAILLCLGFVAMLFAIASLADMRRDGVRWLSSPLVYTLSLSVYCTSWTFYGAVGSAARGGLEFAPIYLGPTLVFIGWWAFLRKIVRIGRSQRITSIADFLSSRFGKSQILAAIVTLVAVVSLIPYIALQLKAVSSSFSAIAGEAAAGGPPANGVGAAFWVAVGMALFTILFGTRSLDSNERHHGVVAAIAVEAIVKLVALLAVGLFALYGVADGVQDAFRRVDPAMIAGPETFDARWVTLTILAAFAVVCLPRQFQVTVVECTDERHGAMASWLFPLYLFLISLFVLPIAVVGAATLPQGADPDLYVLTLPMSEGRTSLALLAFLGGFSSATSMVIVCCIALSTMVSNHLVMPIALRSQSLSAALGPASSGDVRSFILLSRRIAICAILGGAYLYYRLGGAADVLASVGLIAFVGVAQFMPGIIAGLYWPRATARGVIWGLLAGIAIWAALLFLPTLATEWRPPAALVGDDALVATTTLSLAANAFVLCLVSFSRGATPLERLQSALFVNVFRARSGAVHRILRRSAPSEHLFTLAQRILGAAAADRLFRDERARQGLATGLPAADEAFISRLEQELAGSVGAASARALVGQVATGEVVSFDDLMSIADETARIVDYSHRLETKSAELEDAANRLREANERLRQIDASKDEFLSQVSHELRTPMTSLRAFTEILRSEEDLDDASRRRFLDILHDETLRLIRLLDEILDVGRLENAEISLTLGEVSPDKELEHAVATALPLAASAKVALFRDLAAGDAKVAADADRLRQVFVNVISNALKYNDNPEPKIWISTRVEHTPAGRRHVTDIADNGPGVAPENRALIFEKFARGAGVSASGSGLGLAICKRIMERHGGSIDLIEPESGGARPAEEPAGALFRVHLPLAETAAERAAE